MLEEDFQVLRASVLERSAAAADDDELDGDISGHELDGDVSCHGAPSRMEDDELYMYSTPNKVGGRSIGSSLKVGGRSTGSSLTRGIASRASFEARLESWKASKGVSTTVDSSIY